MRLANLLKNKNFPLGLGLLIMAIAFLLDNKIVGIFALLSFILWAILIMRK